jgi:hypothetical protein
MSELNIHQRLAEVMKSVGYIQKDKDIIKNGRVLYRVVSHDTVIRETRPHFIEHGITVIPTITDHARQGANLTIANIQVEFVNIDNPEDKITVNYFGYGVDKSDKGPGKAISYAVRYAILKVLCLETGDDPENDTDDAKEETITDEQEINLREICDSKNFPIDKTLEALANKIFQIKSISDLPQSKFEDAKKMLMDKPANETAE